MSKPKTVKRGIVQKVIKPLYSSAPEKAEIVVPEAEDLYREIRIENALEDDKGEKHKLKERAVVDVVIAADPKDTLPEGGGRKDKERPIAD